MTYVDSRSIMVYHDNNALNGVINASYALRHAHFMPLHIIKSSYWTLLSCIVGLVRSVFSLTWTALLTSYFVLVFLISSCFSFFHPMFLKSLISFSSLWFFVEVLLLHMVGELSTLVIKIVNFLTLIYFR